MGARDMLEKLDDGRARFVSRADSEPEVTGRYVPDLEDARRAIAADDGPITVNRVWLWDVLDLLDEARAHCRRRGERIDKVEAMTGRRRRDIARLHAEKVALRDMLMQVALGWVEAHKVKDYLTENSEHPWDQVRDRWLARRSKRIQAGGEAVRG